MRVSTTSSSACRTSYPNAKSSTICKKKTSGCLLRLFDEEIMVSNISSGLCHQQLGEREAAAQRFAESSNPELHINDRHRQSLQQGVSAGSRSAASDLD